jgi:hypothetical protein
MSHPYVKVATSRQKRHHTSNLKPHSSTVMTDCAIRASAHPMAVFSGLYESPGPPPSGDARSIVPPHRDDHQNCHQSGYMIHSCFVCCHSGGHQGYTEQVVARWRRPVVSGVTLDMLHWAMLRELLQCLTMAINMVRRGGAFVRRRRLFRLA